MTTSSSQDASPTGCPSVEQVKEFAQGGLEFAERRPLEHHFDQCPGCWKLVSCILRCDDREVMPGAENVVGGDGGASDPSPT